MTARSKMAAGACLIALLTSAAGCLDLKKTYPEKRSFVLDVGEPQQETAGTGTIVLRINKFRVSPLFAGRAMVYRVADLQYESDFYAEWFVAPGTLVTRGALYRPHLFSCRAGARAAYFAARDLSHFSNDWA